MKIGEVLELTQSKKLADVAKEHLTIGEKPAREALKHAGCFIRSGKRGWLYEGDPAVLEKSIYDYVPPKAARKPTFQLSVKEENKEEGKEVGNPDIKENSKPSMKKVTYEIEEQLHDELKIKAIREKRTVSEIVNEIIKRGI
ncbi:hypothetical protein L2D08_23265 [Domibacillus sp. PGB-M46]|uniref:hypothetical protein n=1 Tax=Domibacillus sp. PGB-M46 TaxID=2910255 RepID=UPI001F579103|nr:hypothetical protein [Domibacillus sp. PGB-M46]MCI2257235.1 hypothetical protein [Domibacillus sp. PGB-M46]